MIRESTIYWLIEENMYHKEGEKIIPGLKNTIAFWGTIGVFYLTDFTTTDANYLP